jgi:hypothetical protein
VRWLTGHQVTSRDATGAEWGKPPRPPPAASALNIIVIIVVVIVILILVINQRARGTKRVQTRL